MTSSIFFENAPLKTHLAPQNFFVETSIHILTRNRILEISLTHQVDASSNVEFHALSDSGTKIRGFHLKFQS